MSQKTYSLAPDLRTNFPDEPTFAGCTFRDTHYSVVNETGFPITVRLEAHWKQRMPQFRAVNPSESISLGTGNYLAVVGRGRTRAFVLPSSYLTVIPLRPDNSSLLARLRFQESTALHVVNDGALLTTSFESSADQDKKLPAFGIPPVFEPLKRESESASHERLQKWIADQSITIQDEAIRRWKRIEKMNARPNQ